MRTAVSIPPFTDASTVVALAVEAEQAAPTSASTRRSFPGRCRSRARRSGWRPSSPTGARSRGRSWDGIVPLGPRGYTSPDELAAYLQGVERTPGWDVVAGRAPGVPTEEYASAGATWLIDSAWPVGDWVADLRARVGAGP